MTANEHCAIFEARVLDDLVREIGGEGLCELLRLFPHEMAKFSVELTRAFEARNDEAAKRARHTMRGMASSLGARGLVAALDALPKSTAPSPDNAGAFARFQARLDDTVEEARQLMERYGQLHGDDAQRAML